jgi:N-acetylglucosaminyl-diphospho-decaprenol L-rhamnosyltransferase
VVPTENELKIHQELSKKKVVITGGEGIDMCDRAPGEQSVVVVVTFNSQQFIGACLESITKGGGQPIVVDSGSTDDTLQIITRHYPFVRLLRTVRNKGYGAALNFAVADTTAEILILANADVVFPPDSISALRAYLIANPKVGVVGPQLVFPDGSWQRSYGTLPGVKDGLLNLSGIGSLHSIFRRLIWPRKVDHHPKSVGYIDGAVMAVRRVAFDSIGGFDEEFFFYGEDADFCFRLGRLGWKTDFLPPVIVTHWRGGSSSRIDSMSAAVSKLHVAGKRLFLKKHRPHWQHGIYSLLERTHARKMALIHRLIASVCSSTQKEQVLRRVAEFSALSQLWG